MTDAKMLKMFKQKKSKKEIAKENKAKRLPAIPPTRVADTNCKHYNRKKQKKVVCQNMQYI